jgi:hypothetical protein
MQLPTRQVSVEPAGGRLPCCEFKRNPKEKPAEQVIRVDAQKRFVRDVFDRKLQLNKMGIVTASGDTVSQTIIKGKQGIPKKQHVEGNGWTSREAIKASMKTFKKNAGAGAILIVMAHHSSGNMIFESAEGKKTEIPVTEMQSMAKEEQISLMLWGCSSAESSSGGIKTEFRLRPMIEATSAALAVKDQSFGEFLNKISESTNTNMQFDAQRAMQDGWFQGPVPEQPASSSKGAEFQVFVEVRPRLCNGQSKDCPVSALN